jgi:membrane protease YdiL (CAAX protease family)
MSMPAVSDPPAAPSWREKLGGFGPLGVLAMLVIVFAGAPIISALLILVWAHLSRTPLRDIGFIRPPRWWRDTALAILAGVTLKFAMKAIVMPLIGAPPINAPYHYLAGNIAAIPGMLFTMIVGAGFGEETLYRGFLFERLRRLFGTSTGATAAIVIVAALWFGVVHYPGQGIPGVQQAFVVGLIAGVAYAWLGRLWPLMVAHAAFDLTALAMIYYDAELRIAHLVFQ